MAIVWDGLVARKFVLKDTNTSRNRKWNMKAITNVSPPPPPLSEDSMADAVPPLSKDSMADAVPKISNDECLYCNDTGSLLVCEFLGCPLVAHGECDGLSVKDTKRLMKSADPWFCPDHRPPPPIADPLLDAQHPASDVVDGSAAVIDPADPAPANPDPSESHNPIPEPLPEDTDLASAAAATTAAPAPAGKSSATVGQAITFVSLSETLGFLSMKCGEGLHEEVPTNLQTAFDEFKKMIEMHLRSKQAGGVAAAAPQQLATEIPMQPPLAGVAIIASAPGSGAITDISPAILQSAAVPFKKAAGRSSGLPPRIRRRPQDRDSSPPAKHSCTTPNSDRSRPINHST